MNRYPLLVEIGCENMPSSDIDIIQASAVQNFSAILDKYRIGHTSVKVMTSVRRIAVKINRVNSHQEPVTEIKKGPPASVVLKDGKPTKAGLGFARSMGVAFDDLVKKETLKGEYFFCKKEIEPAAVRDIIPDIVREFINSFEFPITMRWGGSAVWFPRPIRWLLVKFGQQAVKFKLGNLSSGRSSRGHYIFADRKVYVDKIKDYVKLLKRNYVYADPDERMDCLQKAVRRPLKYTRGYPVEKSDLLQEINNSVEFPTGVKGTFPEKYLTVPREIIEACLVYHQKYFPVEDKEGNLMNYFVGVRDGISEYLETIRKGYQKVLIARLDDAEFFLSKDREKKLADYVENLEGVQFSRGLGTLRDKTDRLCKLAKYISGLLDKDKDFIDKAERAAYLAKADLASHIVDEFPELEGTAGSIYAKLDGEDKDVALSVREHYFPANPGDSQPSIELAAVVGAADRMDTVCGNIGSGVEVSGSADPFGLRRALKGLISIMASFNWDLDMAGIVVESLKIYKKQGIKLNKNDSAGITGFIKNQLENYLLANFDYD
ncbi:MAG: glycine--tRNA ligase subunit beta, partial [Elusimicrobiota bacterium]|nr:glycine--tRNA ligase subunit beta [Elusimicrobiota bacterium]